MLLEDRQRIVEDLYHRTNKKVHGLCSRYIYDKHQRDEIVQEIFLNCFENLEGFQSKSALETWLYRISVNRCLNFIRAKKCKKRDAVVVGYEEWSAPSTRAIQFDHMIAKEIRDKLERIQIERDGEHSDKVKCYLMAHLHGMSYLEIADTLGLNVNTVRSRIARAKNLLKRRFRHMAP